MKRKATWLLAALAVTGSMGSDWARPHTRVPCLPGIPARDYQPQFPLPQPSALVQGMSFKGVEIAELAGVGIVGRTSVKLRTFAMDQKELRVQHCSISEVAFTIRDNGQWIFNCRADQNPWFTKQPNALPVLSSPRAPTIETNHLLRNEFFVTVRCYGNFPLKEAKKSTGKPALAVIGPISFMVQRGVPFVANVSEARLELQQYYPLIDRIEFDFYYR